MSYNNAQYYYESRVDLYNQGQRRGWGKRASREDEDENINKICTCMTEYVLQSVTVILSAFGV